MTKCWLWALLVLAGGWALQRLPLDAFPDTTPVQVTVNTVAPTLSPLEVERQITTPVEAALNGLPGLHEARSVSKFGFSQITLIFADEVDIWLARQVVSERLGAVELPAGIAPPTLGPVSTGLGEVFHYVIRAEGYDLTKLPPDEARRKLTELRTVHDWVIKPQLRAVSGVAERKISAIRYSWVPLAALRRSITERTSSSATETKGSILRPSRRFQGMVLP